ncbi:hypothetical protein GCM10012319_41340 [Comamonas sp. KCTC 72670]|nr:hypothetical protein GCM10012319_41340 [Comamonas sp. KCTC 72670]
MVLLRQVHQLEVDGEGPQHGLGLLQGKALEHLRQLGRHRATSGHGAAPALDGEAAHLLFQIEELLPFLFDEHFAQEPAQQADVPAKRLIHRTQSSHMVRR